MSTVPLAITCGDPAGIGPEVIAAWLAEQGADASADVEILGPATWLEQLPPGGTRQPVGQPDYSMTPGQPDDMGAVIAWQAMQRAAIGCCEGRYRGVVTGPVSKARLAAMGYPHPGQTEFFAETWRGNPVMAFRGDRLRVTLATWHLPLAEVPAALTPATIQRAVRAAHDLAQADGVAEPRIGVCGLNPHAGEDGLLGDEEKLTINPVLDQIRSQLPGVSAALPGDTVFGRALQGEFDVVVAMYHDQGLGPLKTVDFANAVNVTLGLPHVRTSPDHGTAFDIAGQSRADATSFARAVELARRFTA